MRRFAVCSVLLLGPATLGACAHAEFTAPDPMTEAALRVDDLTGADGDRYCAAQRVDLERSFRALQDTRAEQRGVARQSTRWTEHEARAMNLSQASSLMSQSLATAKSEGESARAGVPGANLRVAQAVRDFDVYANATSSAGARPLNPGEASVADESWKAAQYATVWSEFFGQPEGSAERAMLLEWLTSRSARDIAILREYHEDFRGALKHTCD